MNDMFKNEMEYMNYFVIVSYLGIFSMGLFIKWILIAGIGFVYG